MENTLMERRKYARLALHSDANIKHDETVIMGVVENLSMKGVFVKTTGKIPLNDSVEVTIFTYSTPDQLCDLQATVVRVTETGIGLEFEKTILD